MTLKGRERDGVKMKVREDRGEVEREGGGRVRMKVREDRGEVEREGGRGKGKDRKKEV